MNVPCRSDTRTYDANGNLITAGGRTYAWNAANRLTSVTPPWSQSRHIRVQRRRRAGESDLKFADDHLPSGSRVRVAGGAAREALTS